MKYNFDEITDRKNSCSVKYDLCRKLFGTDDVLPMWVADMDFKTPDFICNAIQKRAAHDIYGYTFHPPNYYKSTVNWLEKRHQWQVKASQLSTSPGVVPSLNMAIIAFSEPGDKIIIQPPVYYPFFSVIEVNKRQIVTNPLLLKNRRYYIDFDDFRAKAKDAKVFLFSNPQNPGGTVWTQDELETLGEICYENNVLIISDEIHADLIFKGHKHIPLASINERFSSITITCMAPSKTFNTAGLATSFVVCQNPDLLAKYNTVLEQIHIANGNLFGNLAMEAAYTHGKEWLEQLMDYLQNNLEFLCSFFKEHIPEINVIIPEGTYLVWLDCRKMGMTVEELKSFMINEAKLGLSDGACFGQEGKGFQRINIACPKSILTQALEQLENAMIIWRDRRND